ncbi:MAG TPA: sodium/proton-translocating pyrophosphatase, partial [Polyangiaceae bacterium]
ALVVRADTDGSLDKALARGHATSLVVTLGGLIGTCLWLSPPAFWPAATIAGAAGLAAVTAAAFARRFGFERRSTGQRELGEWLRLGDTPTLAAGLADGLRSVVLPAALLGAAISIAWSAGLASGVPHGGVFAALVALMSMLAPAANFLAARTLSAVTASVRSAPNALGEEEGEVAARARRLETTSLLASAMARVYLAEIGCATAWFCVVAAVTGEPLALSRASSLDSPMGLFVGALGGCLVLWYAGSGLRAALRGTRAVVLEVQRQLRGHGRERGAIVLPEDFTPSYKNCIDESAGAARRGLVWPPALAVLSPAALGIALSLLYRRSQPEVAGGGLVTFVVVTALTALGVSLVADAASATFVASRRMGNPTLPGFHAAVSGDAAAQLIGDSIGSAAHLLAKSVAVVCLMLAPFLL